MYFINRRLLVSSLWRFSLVALVLCMSSSVSAEVADLVLRNGKIMTVDEGKPEARAVAIAGDRILAVGNDNEIDAFVGADTYVIDLGGKLLIPGFIEGHAHFMGLGRSKMILDLAQPENWDEIITLVKTAVENAKPDDWILGRGWHQDKWNRLPDPVWDGLPYHDALSLVSPENPVMLTHASGHSVIANARAIELAGVSESTPDPEGGEIVRDSAGGVIGVFREAGSELLQDALDRYLDKRSQEEIETDNREVVKLAGEECLSNGITSFHDAGSSFETIDLYMKLAQDDQLPLRLYVMVSDSNRLLKENLSKYKTVGAGNNYLTVRAIKRVIDGALGSHGAWLLEPYEDIPSSRGLNTESIEAMEETAKLAIEHDFQLCTHAIGDRANRETLNIYESAFKSYPTGKERRWRIEHAQHLNSEDIPRFGQLGVIAAMQGVHCTSDGPWVPKRIGDGRSEEGAYVWQKLINSGAVVTNGTDAPVESISPLAGFYASISRCLPDGSSFYPEQRMTRYQALKSYTINNAYAAFEEDIKGSISVGKLADLVVLSQDILTVAEDEIPQTEIVLTIIGGKIVYKKD